MPNADELYLRSREELLPYEDTRLNSLLQALANFYSTRNDQSIWGQYLRAVAMELARLEYAYTYDIVSKHPGYLTPPDIKRKFADVLRINRSYPQKGQFDSGDFSNATADFSLQYPLGYLDMLNKLIEAYNRGALIDVISSIVYAYTGKRIKIQEFYTNIPTDGTKGFFDASYRNTIGVRVKVGGNDALSDIQNLRQLQQITQSLYGAIDLAKPAHVGLEFAAVFGADENIGAFIEAIQDTFRMIIKSVEEPPFQPMLYQAPIKVIDPMTKQLKNPKTTLVGYGRGMSPTLSIADYNALPNKPARVAAAAPAIADGYYLDGTQYVVGFAKWKPSANYATGQLMVDGNGNLQRATTGGVSGDYGLTKEGVRTRPDPDNPGQTITISEGYDVPALPTLATNKGDTFTDGTVVWTCEGQNTLTDPAKWIQVVNKQGQPTGEVSNWDSTHPAGLVAPRQNQVWEISGEVWTGDNF